MAFQKGPGEGYMAAKDDVLAVIPNARCRTVYYRTEVAGYVVEREGQTIGRGRTARDAWNDALGLARADASRPTPEDASRG